MLAQGLVVALGLRQQHDALAEQRVGHADGGRLLHAFQGKRDFFDLGGADAIARGLDQLIVATDEIQKTLAVASHLVTRPDSDLRHAAPGGLARRWAKTLRGHLRIVPVALCHQRAAVHQFAGLVDIAFAAIGAHHHHLGIRDGFADAVGPLIDQLRVETGRPKGLGQSVHQKDLRVGQGASQGRSGACRHTAAGTGDVAQAFARALWPVELAQLIPQGRHGSHAGNALFDHRTNHIPGQQVLQQHHRGAGKKGADDLVESVIKAQRQQRQQAVVWGDLQIVLDAARAGTQVGVREHHALGFAGAAGCVEDRRDVRIDARGQGAWRLLAKICGAMGLEVRVGTWRHLCVDQHQVAQGRAVHQHFAECRHARLAGDQDVDITVAQNMTDLFGFQHRVDRHEHAACQRGAEQPGDRFDLLGQVGGDARAGRGFELQQ